LLLTIFKDHPPVSNKVGYINIAAIWQKVKSGRQNRVFNTEKGRWLGVWTVGEIRLSQLIIYYLLLIICPCKRGKVEDRSQKNSLSEYQDAGNQVIRKSGD
jgi:hypothetical protein